ncbi:MAG: hypothetical protein L6Q37_10010 [Bdellovibrionaceae bacterium]|nr:hypothetical protein [Pseudobdellovibrionaceae bacterium]
MLVFMTTVFLKLSLAQANTFSTLPRKTYICLSYYEQKLKSQALQIRRNLIANKTKSFMELPIPKINHEKELTQLKEIKTNGFISVGVAYTGFYKNQKVFIKKINLWLQKAKGFSEFHWLYYLNSLGIGTKLLGYSTIDGELHIVTEYIDGVDNKQFSSPLESKKYLTPAAVKIINNHKAIFEEIGIYAEDLQFMFSPDGKVTLIDTEGFSLIGGKYLKVDLDDKIYSREPFNDFFYSLSYFSSPKL